MADESNGDCYYEETIMVHLLRKIKSFVVRDVDFIPAAQCSFMAGKAM